MFELSVKWPLIVTQYDKIYFNRIDLGNYTMFRMCIFKTFTPRLGLYASIESKGSYFFGSGRELHKDYVADKLFLQGDSGQIADFLNVQLGFDGTEHGQQGHYYLDVIKGVEPYGCIGEDYIMPWCPEILNERTKMD